MNGSVKVEISARYSEPSLEILPLACSDVITSSTQSSGFWGEEHEFENEYDTYEW